MIIKFCLGPEIHKLSKTPDNYKALLEAAKNTFLQNLPSSFLFKYQDAEGDMVILNSDEDYKILLSNPPPNRSVKIYIVPTSFEDIPVFESQVIKAPEVKQEPVFSQNIPNDNSKPSEEFKIDKNKKEPLDCDEVLSEEYEDVGKPKQERRGWKFMEGFAADKKSLRDQAKLARKIAKAQQLKDAMTEVLYDNLPAIAGLIKDFISNPSENLEEKVQKVRPKTQFSNLEAEVDPAVQMPCGIKPFFKGMFREMGQRYNELPDNTKKIVNEALGGIPEKLGKIFFKMNENQDIQPSDFKIEPAENNDIQDKGEGLKKKRGKPKKDGAKEKPEKEEKPKGDKPKSNTGWRSDKVRATDNKPNKSKEEKHEKGEKSKEQNKREELQKVVEKKPYDYQFKEISTIPIKITEKEKVVYKTISFKNTGTEEWPGTTFVMPIDGLDGQVQRLSNIAPGKDISGILIINSPGKPGSHKSVWRVAYKNESGQTLFIGEPLELTVTVSPSNKPEEKPSNEEKLKKYPEQTRQRVEEMKKIFPQADIEQLAEFVNQSPNLSMDELVESFLLKK